MFSASFFKNNWIKKITCCHLMLFWTNLELRKAKKNPQLCWYSLRSQMSDQVLFPYLHIPPVLSKRPRNVLKTSQSDSYISRNFPIFPDVNFISDIAEPKKVKNLIYHGPKRSRPKLDHKGTSLGRCVLGWWQLWLVHW